MVGDHVKFKWEEWVVRVCVCYWWEECISFQCGLMEIDVTS